MEIVSTMEAGHGSLINAMQMVLKYTQFKLVLTCKITDWPAMTQLASGND